MNTPLARRVLGFCSALLVLNLMLSSSLLPAPAQTRFDPNKLPRYFDVNAADPDEFFSGLTTTNTHITLELTIGRETPDAIAVFVGVPHPPLHSPAIPWIPFTKTLRVDLGAAEGDCSIFVAARWKDTHYEGSGFDVTVSRSKPTIWITRPVERITPMPIIQIQGQADKHVLRCSYDHLDSAGQVISQNEDGLAGSNYPGGDPRAAFTLFDVKLVLGTNTFVLRCTDDAGNTTTTNFSVVFSTAGDKQPPVFRMIQYPRSGTVIGGDRFMVRGVVDDYTATLTGQIVGGGQTNQITGYAERNGFFWYEDLPLPLGSNQVTLIATDFAGNIAHTNLMVVGASGPLVTLDDIVPAQKLWERQITVTGTLSPPNHRLWVNGVAAVVKADGKWIAHNVPTISPDGGGAATFDMTTEPLETSPAPPAPPQAQLLTNARLDDKPLTLNATRPACGLFHLHVSDTAGKPFLLLASTNLMDWTPILTNHNPNATFDYTETNIATNACRFFQIRPLK